MIVNKHSLFELHSISADIQSCSNNYKLTIFSSSTAARHTYSNRNFGCYSLISPSALLNRLRNTQGSIAHPSTLFKRIHSSCKKHLNELLTIQGVVTI